MNGINLQGHTALVTGSSRGIGRGMADAMQAAGAKVVYQSYTTSPDSLPAGTTCLQADLSQPDAPQELIDEAFAAAPELDTLVSNAGSFYDIPFLEMTPERWEQTMSLNARAPYFLIQAFARRMIELKRHGSVVIVGSTNGFQAEYDSSAYDASKGALVMMTKSLALDLSPYKIRVNSVAPGLIRTPLTERWLDSDDVARAHYERTIPMGRIGLPEDCAGAAVFLCSDAASFITGHVLVVDGGLTVGQIGKP